jgi:hypothetical protein
MAYGPSVVNSSSACQSHNNLAKTSARTRVKSLMQSKLPHVDSTDRFDRTNEDKGLVSSGSGARIGGRGLHHTTLAQLCGVVCSGKPASPDADRVIIARGSVVIGGSLPRATRPAQVEERTSPRTPKPLSRNLATPPAPERRKPSSLATKGRKAWLPRTSLWRAGRTLCARSVAPRPETPAPPSVQTALSRRRVLQNQFGPGVAPRRAGAAFAQASRGSPAASGAGAAQRRSRAIAAETRAALPAARHGVAARKRDAVAVAAALTACEAKCARLVVQLADARKDIEAGRAAAAAAVMEAEAAAAQVVPPPAGATRMIACVSVRVPDASIVWAWLRGCG